MFVQNVALRIYFQKYRTTYFSHNYKLKIRLLYCIIAHVKRTNRLSLSEK